MMREKNPVRRRYVAVVALVLALCVGAPGLVEAAAATTRSASRTEITERAAARPAARPAAGARHTAQQPSAAIRRQRARRKAARAKKARARKKKANKRKKTKKKKKAKRKSAATKRKNALKAKRAKNKKKRAAAATKKNKSKSGLAGLSLMGWLEVAFFALLPFLAVGALLFGTDYQRKPRAPSRPRRKRSLVITPVSRKF